MTKNAPYDTNRITKLDPKWIDLPAWYGRANADEHIVFIAPNPEFDKNSRFSRRYRRAIQVQIFWRGNTCSAFICLHGRNETLDARGVGHASGGGYHKESAAIDAAFENAGFTFARSFACCGDPPVDIAIQVAARRLGWKTGEVMRFS